MKPLPDSSITFHSLAEAAEMFNMKPKILLDLRDHRGLRVYDYDGRLVVDVVETVWFLQSHRAGHHQLKPQVVEVSALAAAEPYQMRTSYNDRMTARFERLLEQNPFAMGPISANGRDIIDGHYRRRATVAVGNLTIQAYCFSLPAKIALELAIRTNVEHGIPLDDESMGEAARRLIQSRPDILEALRSSKASYRSLERDFGIPHTTLHRRVQELTNTGNAVANIQAAGVKRLPQEEREKLLAVLRALGPRMASLSGPELTSSEKIDLCLISRHLDDFLSDTFGVGKVQLRGRIKDALLSHEIVHPVALIQDGLGATVVQS